MTRAAPGEQVTAAVTLVRRLGAGGMGSVWIARHAGLRADVVVKLMAEGLVASAEFRARFAREAAAAAQVKSPHVVQVFDAGVSDELGPYIVMELLEGEDLATRLEGGGRLQPREVVALVEQTARALDAAHARGVVHRDVKPPNLFLCAGLGDPLFVKVLDFGVAKLKDEGVRPTAVGVAIGTPTYMSPEQAAGSPEIGPPSDLFALGLVAFRALTGRTAYPPEMLEALSLGAYNLPPPRLTEHLELPPAVDAWFARACARDPAARFPDGAAMARALGEALAGAPETTARPAPRARDDAPRSEGPTGKRTGTAFAPTESAPPRAAPPSRRRLPARAALAAAAALLATGIWLERRAATHGDAPGAPLPTRPSAAAAPPSPVPMGALLDMTGVRKRQGRAMEAAARAAVAQVNAAGGVAGRPVELVVIDDEGDVGAHLDAATARLLALPGLKVLLGPMTSEQVLRVAPRAQAAGVLEITASATSPELATLQPKESRTLFRTTPSDASLARALARVARAAPAHCASLAIVAQDDVAGRPAADELARAFERDGGRVAARVVVPVAAKIDYAKELGAVAAARADCEALLVGPKAAARFLRQRRTAGARGAPRATFGLADLANEDFLAYAREDARDPASPTVADGVQGVRAATTPTWRPELRELTHLLADADAGAPPALEPFVASEFDAAVLGALALAQAGPEASGTALAQALVGVSRSGHVFGPGELDALLRAIRRGEEVNYSGASGDVELGDDGDVDADIVAWSVVHGRVVEGGRAPR